MDFDAFSQDAYFAEQQAWEKQSHKRDTSSKMYNTYQMLEELGAGAYGVVTKAKHILNRGLYAIKHIDKRKAGHKGLNAVMSEVETMSLLTHPNIVHMEEIFQDDSNLWIVMDYVPGGELAKALKRVARFEEHQVRRMAIHLLLAVDYIHSKGIVHRDLKPANCLLCEEGEMELKLADFGFAVMVGGTANLTSFCGTTAYMAPEIVLDKPYGKEVDMWAVGVMLYLLMSGDYPFEDRKNSAMAEEIAKCNYNFNDNPIWEHASVGVKDLISKLLVEDPEKRLCAHDALLHYWVKAGMSSEFDYSELLSDKGTMGSAASARTAQKVKKTPKTKLKGGVYTVIGAHRLIYSMRCIMLKREGVDLPILRSYSFLVSGKYNPPGQAIVASNMCYNNPKAILQLVHMLQASNTVDTFDVSNNGLDSLDVLQEIVRVATNHASLTVLNLENNPIPSLAGRALLRLARSAAHLKVINVNNTTLGADVIAQIGVSLKDLDKKRADHIPQLNVSSSSPASTQHHGMGPHTAFPVHTPVHTPGSRNMHTRPVASPASATRSFQSGFGHLTTRTLQSGSRPPASPNLAPHSAVTHLPLLHTNGVQGNVRSNSRQTRH